MIGNLYASLKKNNKDDYEITYNTELSKVIMDCLRAKNYINKYLEFNFNDLKVKVKNKGKDLNFFPAILMDLAFTNYDYTNIINRLHNLEFNSYSSEIIKSECDASTLVMLTKYLIKYKTKEEAFKRLENYNYLNRLSNDVREAVNIFNESNSFKDCLLKTETKPPHIKAIALNLAEAFYDYIDPEFMSNLYKTLSTLNFSNTLEVYLENKYIHIKSLQSLNIDSPVLFYQNKIYGSNCFDKVITGKNVDQLFEIYLNEILNQTIEYIDFNNPKYKEGLDHLDVLGYLDLVIESSLKEYPDYQEYVKLLQENIKGYDSNHSYDYFNEHIVKLTNTIMNKLTGSAKKLILFEDLSSFMDYINKINYDGKLFNIY